MGRADEQGVIGGRPGPVSEDPDDGSRDPRLLFLAGAVTVLVALVSVILLAGSGGAGEASAEAPANCIRAWNRDPDALAYGSHNFGSHGYDIVRVDHLTETGEDPDDDAEEFCAVVFGALELDSEPIAAGQIRIDGVWTPLSMQPDVALTRVAELQAIAAGDPNASLTGEGALAAD